MKPGKFHRSAPHLPVKNVRETLDYYRDVLGFYEEWTYGDKDGGIQRDDMRILFAEDPGHAAAINTQTNRLNLMWFVDNIDEIFSELKQRGVGIESPLQQYPYGLREFAFIDINGYYIRVAEGVENE